MCQERLKLFTSDLPVIPHRFRMCFAIVVQDVDCRSGQTSGFHGRRSLSQRLMQSSYPSGSMGAQGPLER